MTVDEIFSQLLTHMLTGMMVHEGFANYYSFLGLYGYERCHEYHHFEETCSYRKIYTYYIEHFNQLVALNRVENPEVIPSFWYGHTRQEVDQNTKKESIKSGANGWVNWEKDTKKLYEKLYSELININEIAAAEKVKELIIDVDYELKEADDFLLKLIAVNYDMSVIIPEQEKENKKYMRKLEDFKIC